MKQLLYTEWLKVKNYRTFWIMLLVAVIVIPAGNYVPAQVMSSNDLEQAAKMLGQSPFGFPVVWQTVANISSYMTALLGLMLIILVTNEYTFRTNRQNIIDGWERRQFVYAKLIWVVLLSLAALLTAVLTAFVCGLVYGSKSFSLEGFSYMWYYWLQVVLELCLALLAAVLVKRAGFAMAIFLGYIMMLEQTLVLLLKKYAGPVGGLLPLQTGDELLPFPLVGKMVNNMSDRYDDSVYLTFLLGYIALIIYLVFRKVLKSDL
ncbi:ABC transporter permease [Chitinophaga oryzae]|uniref:ABC transporter permease n=1 Tax=Chitinophaga oryzae TaxID=2725414 RepID=A0AAE6ZL46_9BACT|nr:ABC transporter permease [Chitinophaga oryzae]QJB35229.1 ABC transporter permease [Chitinophaga oryzae]QJB41764.1 ABC transporter permease [Chitinophaga oryzae]